MAIELAKAYVQIVPSMDGVPNQIEDALNKTDTGSSAGKSIGSKLAGGIGTAVKASAVAIGAGAVAATGAVASLAKQSLEAYADYEQLTGGVETLFKSSGDTVMQYANEAYKTAGMSANEYMNTVTGFSASMISSLGGDTAKAAELSNQAIIDMSDNANKMGTDIESLQNAYSGFAKGQFNMLDNLKLGYGGTKTEMERLLKDAEKLTGQKYDINSFADITEAIHAIQTEMDITGTTMKEGSSTISGSINQLQGAWQNLITVMGTGDNNAINNAMQNVVDSITAVVSNVIPTLQTILPAIVSGLSQLITALLPEIPPLLQQILPTLLDAILGIFDAVMVAFPELLNTLTAMIPVITERLPEIITSIVTTLIENAPKIIAAGLELMIALAGGLIKAIPEILKKIPEIVTSVVKSFKDNWPKFVEIGTNLVNGIKQGLSDAWGAITEWIKGKAGELISTVKAFFGIASPSKVFRDQVGTNLALGIGEGFVSQMDSVNGMINDSIQTEFSAGVNVARGTLAVGNNSSEDGALALLTEIRNLLASQQIVLDSGTLVGELAAPLDNALSRRYESAMRFA